MNKIIIILLFYSSLIFAASSSFTITVVVPLITVIAKQYHVDPILLAIIFLVNLEIGYLTPPVGLNLFLSSFRFGKSLFEIYRIAVPYLIILLICLVIITYYPPLSLSLIQWLGK